MSELIEISLQLKTNLATPGALAPPSGLALSNNNISEGNTPPTVIGTLSASGNPAPSFAITGGADAASFGIISANQLRLVVAADYETKTSYEVEITAQNSEGTVAQTFTINVLDVAEGVPPSNIQLSNNTIAEGQAAGTVVGNFSANGTTPIGFSLVAGTGATDNTSFEIVSGQLRALQVFDFETKSSYSIRVQADNGVSPNTQSVFTITILDVAEGTPPSNIQISNSSIAENNIINQIVGVFSAVGSPTITFALVSGTGSTDNAAFNISGNNLRASQIFDFETKASYSIRVRASNGNLPNAEQVFTITITNVAEIPGTPAGLAPTQISSQFISLSWSASTGASTYQVQRDTNNAFPSPVTVHNAAATSFTDNTVVASTTYYYRVRATNSEGSSAYSTGVQVTTSAPVTLLHIVFITQSQGIGVKSSPRLNHATDPDVVQLGPDPVLDLSLNQSNINAFNLQTCDETHLDWDNNDNPVDTCAVAFGRQLLANIEATQANAYKICVTISGKGAQTLTNLTKGGASGCYERSMWAMERVSAIASANGWTYRTHHVWMHGGTTSANYKQSLKNHFSAFRNDAIAFTTQVQSEIKIIGDQVRMLGTTPEHARELAGAFEETSGAFLTHDRNYVEKVGDLVHLAANGERHTGMWFAEAMYHILFGSGWQTLSIGTPVFDGTDTIDLPLNGVNGGTLTGSGNYGIRIWNVTDAAYENISVALVTTPGSEKLVVTLNSMTAQSNTLEIRPGEETDYTDYNRYNPTDGSVLLDDATLGYLKVSYSPSTALLFNDTKTSAPYSLHKFLERNLRVLVADTTPPDGDEPVLQSIEIPDSRPDQVWLNYNEVLDHNVLLQASDFPLNIISQWYTDFDFKIVRVTVVEGESRVRIQLGGPLKSTDSLEIGYTGGGLNRIQDPQGNLAATFTLTAVTNNISTDTPKTYVNYYEGGSNDISYTGWGATNPIGFRLYKPPNLKANVKVKAIVFGHGVGFTSRNPDGLVEGLAGIVESKDVPYILMCPAGGTWIDDNEWNQCKDYLKNHPNVDPERITFTGLSGGAMKICAWAQNANLAADHADVASLVVIAASHSVGDGYTSWSKIPTRAYHGEVDTQRAVSNMVAATNGYNGESPAEAMKITIYQGVNHNSWDRTYNKSGSSTPTVQVSGVGDAYEDFEAWAFDHVNAPNTFPVIQLNDDNPKIVELGNAWVDASATASDVEDGDLTGSITKSWKDGNAVTDINIVEIYTRIYSVTDSSAQTTNVEQVIYYEQAGATVPGTPQNLVVTPNNTTLELSWAAPASNGGSKVRRYLVQYKEQSASTWIDVPVEITGTSFVITQLLPGTTYNVRVYADNRLGLSATPVTGQGTISSGAVFVPARIWVNPRHSSAPINLLTAKYNSFASKFAGVQVGNCKDQNGVDTGIVITAMVAAGDSRDTNGITGPGTLHEAQAADSGLLDNTTGSGNADWSTVTLKYEISGLNDNLLYRLIPYLSYDAGGANREGDCRLFNNLGGGNPDNYDTIIQVVSRNATNNETLAGGCAIFGYVKPNAGKLWLYIRRAAIATNNPQFCGLTIDAIEPDPG